MKKTSFKTVEEYLAGVPEPGRGTLNKVRAAIRSAAPAGATEAIGYQMPMFPVQGRAGGVCRVLEAL